MITELERYHGVVLRQLLTQAGRTLSLGVAETNGRVDSYVVEGVGVHVKHSSKRLSPWQFTYLPENIVELHDLRRRYGSVWIMLVCGVDGVVCLSLAELEAVLQTTGTGGATIRVSRNRSAMYRVNSGSVSLSRAVARGVSSFVEALTNAEGRS